MPEGTMASITARVKDYWESASCGTTRTRRTKHSPGYFEEIEEFRYRHEPFIHSFAQFTRWHDKDVLEVGLGAGTDFLQFVRAGARAHGVDLTEESIANVRARLHLYGVEAADLQVCNAQRLPYDDQAFDLVYSWGVIHHAEDPARVFDEIYRVTRPGGSIKLMVYNVNAAHAWYLYLRHALVRGKPLRGRRWAISNHQESFATRAYSRRDLKRLLADYPHSDLRVEYHDQRISRGARLSACRRLMQRVMPASMRWYLAFELRKEG